MTLWPFVSFCPLLNFNVRSIMSTFEYIFPVHQFCVAATCRRQWFHWRASSRRLHAASIHQFIIHWSRYFDSCSGWRRADKIVHVIPIEWNLTWYLAAVSHLLDEVFRNLFVVAQCSGACSRRRAEENELFTVRFQKLAEYCRKTWMCFTFVFWK